MEKTISGQDSPFFISSERSPWGFFLEVLQWSSLVLAMILFFQGKGSHGVFIAIILILPVIRWMLSLRYRLLCRKYLAARWSEIEKFHADHEKSRIPYRAVFTLIVLPILFLGLVNGVSISSMDNYPTMATAASLLLEGNAELSEMTHYKDRRDEICKPGMELPYWLRCTSYGVYSAYPLGMMAFAVPVALMSKIVLGDLGNASVQWRLQKWTAAWVAGSCIAVFFVIALHFVTPGSAIIGTILLSIGSALVSTVSQGLWTHGGVIFGFLLAFLLQLRLACRGNLRRAEEFLTSVLQGACLALMFASRLSAVGLILPFGIWLLFRSPMRGLLVGGVAMALHAPLTFYYWKTYGNFFGPQMQMGQGTGVSSNPIDALFGLLFSPAHGLLIYQPWILLLLMFLMPQVRAFSSGLLKRLNGMANGWAWMFLLGIVFHLAIICLWPCWYGGHCWGSRLLAEIVPLIALFVVFPIEFLKRSNWRLLQPTLSLVVTVSFLMHAPFLYLFAGRWHDDPPKGKIYATEEARFWDWTDPPFLYPVLRGRYLLSQ